MLKGIPGYALEQFFNLGSTKLQVRLDAEEELFNEIVGPTTYAITLRKIAL